MLGDVNNHYSGSNVVLTRPNYVQRTPAHEKDEDKQPGPRAHSFIYEFNLCFS